MFAYIPNGYITGLSKIARIVDVFARRLQVQERLTSEIKSCIQDTLNPLGVAVVIEAQHLCMQMRGGPETTFNNHNIRLHRRISKNSNPGRVYSIN